MWPIRSACSASVINQLLQSSTIVIPAVFLWTTTFSMSYYIFIKWSEFILQKNNNKKKERNWISTKKNFESIYHYSLWNFSLVTSLQWRYDSRNNAQNAGKWTGMQAVFLQRGKDVLHQLRDQMKVLLPVFFITCVHICLKNTACKMNAVFSYDGLQVWQNSILLLNSQTHPEVSLELFPVSTSTFQIF